MMHKEKNLSEISGKENTKVHTCNGGQTDNDQM